MFLTVEKMQHENFDFVLLSSYSSCINQEVKGVYEQSAYQMTALLSEIFLFLVRAACELRSASYGSKRVTDSFLYAILCVLLGTTQKVKVI